MPPRQKSHSEKNEVVIRTQIPKLAKKIGVDPELLNDALEEARHVMVESRKYGPAAKSKALQGLAPKLKSIIERVSEEPIRDRLNAAIQLLPKGPDEDGFKAFEEWGRARHRVEGAIEGATDLLRIIEAAEAFKLPHSRPRYVHWAYGIDFLLDHWTGPLGKKITVSGHENDPRNTRPSPTLEFTYGCMQALGEEITREACRSILRKLQKDRKGGLSAHERLRGSR